MTAVVDRDRGAGGRGLLRLRGVAVGGAAGGEQQDGREEKSGGAEHRYASGVGGRSSCAEPDLRMSSAPGCGGAGRSSDSTSVVTPAERWTHTGVTESEGPVEVRPAFLAEAYARLEQVDAGGAPPYAGRRRTAILST